MSRSRLRLLAYLAVLTVGRLLINSGLRMVYPFLPAFARGLGVSTAQISGLVSLRSFAGVLSPVFSPLSERYGRRPALALALLVMSAGGIIAVLWPAYWGFGAALAAIGIAKVIYDPAMQGFLGDNISYRQRGKAVSITELSWAGAFFLGVPVAGLLLSRYGWPAPFFGLAVLGLASAALVVLVIPAADRRRQQVTGLRQTWQVMRREPVIWAAAVYIFLVMGSNELVLVVFGSWMEGNFGLTLGGLAGAASLIGGAEVTGELLTGVAVDRFGKRPIIILTGVLAAVTYALLPMTGGSLTGALVSLFILFLFFEMTVVGGIPLMTELLPAARAVVMSVVLGAAGLGRALGALAGPLLWEMGGFALLGTLAAAVTLVAVAILARWLREGADVSPAAP